MIELISIPENLPTLNTLEQPFDKAIAILIQPASGMLLPKSQSKKLLTLLWPLITKESFSVGDLQTSVLGKPFVRNSWWHFNLSHTRNAILFTFCYHSELGCDIEALPCRNAWLALANRFFTDAEIAYVKAIGEIGFLQIWTRKEAFLKQTGQGLRVNLKSINVLEPSLNKLPLWSFETNKLIGTICCPKMPVFFCGNELLKKI